MPESPEVQITTHSVSYQIDGETLTESPYATKYYPGGVTVTVANKPERGDEGGTWTFDGWNTSNVEVTDGSFKMPENNVTFTGSWSFIADSYDVIYSWTGLPEGASVSKPGDSKAAYQAVVTVDTQYTNTSTTKVGHDTYTFSGWSTDDVTVTDGKFTMPAQAVEFVHGTTSNIVQG